MALLEIREVSRYFNAEPVLEGVNLSLERGERFGLVGVNGSGKTTLCRLILGTDDPDGGTVTLASGTRVGYLPQDPGFNLRHTVLDEAREVLGEMQRLAEEFEAASEAIGEAGLSEAELEARLAHQARLLTELEARGGFDFEQRLLATLGALGFGPAELDQPVATLSGGEKSRLALAKILSAGCDLLLLDEPTNHLDIQMTEWVEAFLRGFPGGVIVVSHDRWFLDNCVQAIAELEQTELTLYRFGPEDAKLPPPDDPEFAAELDGRHYGAYTHYLRVKADRRAAEWKAYTAQSRELKRQEEWIRWKLSLRRGRHVREAESRQKRLDKIDRVARPADDLPVVKLHFEPRLRGPNDVATLERCGFGYPGFAPLFGGLDLQVRRLERVGIIGPNGCGKSTLLRLLRGELTPTSGRAWMGATADVAFYHQEQADLISDQTPVEALRAVAPQLPLPQVRGYLARFLFFGDDVFRPLRTFSGGERARLALARLIIRRPNVLLLDEPTNHLDIASREVLEEALRGFVGTVITVSHDRYFLEALCRRLVVFDGAGGAEVFEGRYSELEAAREEARAAAEAADVADRAQRRAAHLAAEREGRARKAQRRAAAASRQTVGALETQIEAVEGELAALHERYADPDLYTDGEQVRAIQQREAELQEQLAALFEAYEEALE